MNIYRWVLSIPFFISCIRQQNPLTVLSKIILRKVKQFNLPPPKKMRDFCIFEDTPRLFLLGNRQFTFIAHNLDVAEDVVGQICHRHIRLRPYNPCLSAINAENQQIIKQTPNFIPKNVKLGVFILFKTNHIRSENNLIKNRTNEKNNQFIFRKISYLCSK